MPTLANNANVTLTLTDYDSVTISTLGVATVTAVSGLGVDAGKIGEFSGSRTLGPFTAGSLSIAASVRPCHYEVADGVRPVAQSGAGAVAAITGSYVVGQTLTATFPAGVTGTIQFTRTLAAAPFTKTAISGAVASAVNSLTYQVQSADTGYSIGVDCTTVQAGVGGVVGVVPVGTPPENSTIVTPAQMTMVSGTRTVGTDFDGASILQLANATSEFAVIPDLPLGIKHDVFMNWSVSAVPTNLSPTGLVTLVGALTPWVVGGATPSGDSRWSNIVPPQAPGVIERSQLPWSVTRATSDDLMRIRMGRRADNVGGNVQIRSIEFVPTPAAVEASITQAGTVTPTATSVSLSGSVDLHGFSIYTPIRSSATATYVVEPMTVGGQQQSRIAKLNKSTYATLQEVQIGALNHDSVVGHRDGSVVVTDSGKVICYPEGHHAPWTGKIALTEDLTTLAPMAVPVGLDQQCSYRRFFRNPFDGSTWMCARGNGYLAAVWKFNDTTNTFDRKPAGSMLAGDSAGFLGSYGMELAFGSTDIIYATTEWYQGTTSSTLSGYPRQNLSVVKSVDGGATWQTMRGKAVKTPMVQQSVDDDIAFPANNAQHNGAYGRLAVGADGQPVLVATWQHPSDATRSLWVAKWDNTAKKWIRQRLFRSTTAFDVGNPHLAYHDGKIIVSISTTDDHTPGPSSSGGGGERVPPNNNILLFVTTDNAATWRRYDVNHLAGGYGGAYIDAEALRLDSKLRMRPVNESAPATSVIWEMAVPA